MSQDLLQQITDGHTDLVIDYVAAGNAATSANERGFSLIQWCAHYGDVTAIKFLLANGAPLQMLGENLDLNGAVFHGHVRLCAFLIERGANVNHPLPDTAETPLHAAICTTERKDRDKIIKLLVANGASPNCHTKPNVETDAFMRDCRTKGETPLHRAAAFGNEETIQLLLDAGAQVDVKDMHGDSPLGWASWHLRPRSVLRKLCYGKHRA